MTLKNAYLYDLKIEMANKLLPEDKREIYFSQMIENNFLN